MLTVGSFVKFSWWSSYRAPSISSEDLEGVTWHELHPGDAGIVVHIQAQKVVVLFSRIDTLLKVHESMLEIL